MDKTRTLLPGYTETTILSSSTILGISLSMKPMPGLKGASAARNILTQTLQVLSSVYKDVTFIDIRDYPLPMFSGLKPNELNDECCDFWQRAIKSAGSLFISVPAYWSGISGVSKNFFDVLCGPSYNYIDGEKNIFFGKNISAIIVAADEQSAIPAYNQLVGMAKHMEWQLIGDPIVVADPRSNPITDLQMQNILSLGAQLAKQTILNNKE